MRTSKPGYTEFCQLQHIETSNQSTVQFIKHRRSTKFQINYGGIHLILIIKQIGSTVSEESRKLVIQR